MGADGRAELTADGGRLWHVVQSPTTEDLSSVACPSATSCVAVGSKGIIEVTEDKGVTWSSVRVRHLVDQPLTGVACPSISTCVVVGALGLVIRTTDGGSTWKSDGNLGAQLTSVSCFKDLCSAVSLRTALDSPGMAYVSDDVGDSWFGQDVDEYRNFYSVQCTSVKSCTAVGDEGAIDATTNRGETWGTSSLPEFGSVNSISCLPRTPCIVGGEFGSMYRWLGGARWKQVVGGSEPVPSYQTVESISCVTGTRCWAVGDQGTVETTDDGGYSWSTQMTTPVARDPRVLLVGDSVAQTFGEEIPSVDTDYGIYLMDEGILGCGIAEGEPVEAGGVTFSTVATPCDGQTADPQWPAYWQQYVAGFDPSVAILLAGFWEVTNRMYQGQWSNILEPAYQSYIAGQLQLAVQTLSARGAKVVLLTSPYFDTGNYPEDDPERVDEYNALVRQVAAEYPSTVTVIDLNAFVDPGGTYVSTVDGVVVRDADGEHFSPAGSLLVARWLLPQIKALAAAS